MKHIQIIRNMESFWILSYDEVTGAAFFVAFGALAFFGAAAFFLGEAFFGAAALAFFGDALGFAAFAFFGLFFAATFFGLGAAAGFFADGALAFFGLFGLAARAFFTTFFSPAAADVELAAFGLLAEIQNGSVTKK